MELDDYVRPTLVEIHCLDRRGKRTGIVAYVIQTASSGYTCTIKEGGDVRAAFTKRTFGGVIHALTGDAVRERVPEGVAWTPVRYVPECSANYQWRNETA
jgi:hypothetical protein